jgi:flagellar protein FliS
MTVQSRNLYLETEILTATPQRLRKMLLDGAVRFSIQASELHRSGQVTEAHDALDRCSEIVAELLSAIQASDDVAEQIKGIYVFLLTQIAAIRKEWCNDAASDLIEVLEMERETWRLVCEMHPDRLVSDKVQSDLSSHDAHQILSEGLGDAETSTRIEFSTGFELDA